MQIYNNIIIKKLILQILVQIWTYEKYSFDS